MTTTINIRISKDLKEKATKLLASMGMDMSTAIKLFLTQTVIHNGLPFKPTGHVLEMYKKAVKKKVGRNSK